MNLRKGPIGYCPSPSTRTPVPEHSVRGHLHTPHTQRGLARPSPQDLSRSPATLSRRAFSGLSNPTNACPATLRAAQCSTREAKVAGESSPCELPTVWPVALVGFLLETCNSCLDLLHKPSVPPVPAVPTLPYPPPYSFLLRVCVLQRGGVYC